MSIGFTFEQALHNLGDSLESDLSKRYIDLVIQASYSGGSVSNLIQQAAIDMGNFLTIDKEKRSGLARYTIVLYTGQVVLIRSRGNHGRSIYSSTNRDHANW